MFQVKRFDSTNCQISSLYDDFSRRKSSNIGELGGLISGGQRQRIAIARALYTQKPYLIMDEATSALDSLTEERILAGIRKYFPDITLINVSHRMSSATLYDRVIMLNNDRLPRVNESQGNPRIHQL